MNTTFTLLTVLLLAPLAALHAAEPPVTARLLHPYVTAGDPNISRAFRIACGDVSSSVVPMAAATVLPNLPLNAKRWEAVSARIVEVAGTRDVLPAQLLAAGLDYGISPIDAAMDSWNGASFLQPEAMKGALLTSLVPDEDGTLRCGGPYYEILTWTFGAWEHYLATGDRPFLKVALSATLGGLAHSERNEYDAKLNLFRGPAIIGDGISAYPDTWAEAVKGAGHVMRWPQLNPDKKLATGYGIPIHALSTQCMAYEAYHLAARMQRELGVAVDAALEEKAERLKVAINRHFWREDAGTYRYLVDTYGGSDAQEGFGNSVAILFGIASTEQAARIFKSMHITPQGIPYNWPVFPRYASPDGTTFGNHNGTIWPPVSALWAQAAASSGRTELFALELKKLADRGCRDSHFSEIYHPITGEIYGGLQEGRTGRSGASMRAFIAARLGGSGEATDEAIAQLFPATKGKNGISLWQSCARNLYTSTAYLRMVLHGLCGIRLDADGITFHPTIPKGMSPVAVYELPYRQAELEIHITGEGNVVKKLTINGQETRTLPTTTTGKQLVRIEMVDTNQ
jgi:hypothetical protein